MAVHLSGDDIKTVVETIDGWPLTKKLTWQSLLEECSRRLGRLYTRQAFARYDRIQRAYQARKRNYQFRNGRFRGRSVELTKASERIQRLEAENMRLESENHALLEQFARWAYNAYTKNIDEETLNRPLPKIDRQRTKR